MKHCFFIRIVAIVLLMCPAICAEGNDDFQFMRDVECSSFKTTSSVDANSIALTLEQQQEVGDYLDQCKNNIIKTILPNGFTILVYPLTTTQSVKLQIVYRAGSKDEEPQERGNAHFIEHLLFSGTDRMSETDIDEIADKFAIGALGQGYNASTWFDKTQYYFLCNKENWQVFMDITADCMKNARFGEPQLISELKRILEELKCRNHDGHDDLFGELLPKNHPYHVTPGGFSNALVGRSSDDLRAFYKRHYRPDRSALIVVGNVDPDAVIAQATELFSAMENPQQERSLAPRFAPFCKEKEFFKKEVTVYRSVPNPEHSFVWVTPGLQDSETVALEPIQDILQKRLERLIKDEKDLVLNIGAGLYQLELCGMAYVSFQPKENEQIGDLARVAQTVRQLVEQEIEKLRSEGITQQELDAYKLSDRVSFLNIFDKVGPITELLTFGFTTGQNEYEVFDRYCVGQDLNVAEVNLVLEKYFDQLDMHTLSIVPHPTAAEEARWQARQIEQDAYDEKLFNSRVRTEPLEAPRFAQQTGEPKMLSFTFDKPDYIFTLSNGLDVYYKYCPAVPFVSAALCYKSGERMALSCAVNGQAALPALTLGSVGDGTPLYSKHELQDFFDSVGASVSYGSRVYFSTLKYNFDRVADRIFYALSHPTFPKSYFYQWKAGALSQLAYEPQLPAYQLRHVLSRYFKNAYPWSKPHTEEAQALKGLQYDDMVNFYNNYVNPTNFYMVVAGDIALDDLRKKLEAASNQWATIGLQLPTMSAIPNITNAPAEAMAKNLPQERTLLAVARLSPKLRTTESLALGLMSNFIDRKLTQLSQKDSLYYGAGFNETAGATALTNGISCFMTQVSTANADLVIQKFLELIADLGQYGIPQDALDKAKMTMLNDLASMQETSGAIVGGYGYLVGEGLDWDYYNQLIDTITTMSLDTVNAVAADHFDPTQWSSLVVGRVDESLPSGVKL